MTREELRDNLAEYAHIAWSGWMEHLFRKSASNPGGTVTIPKWAVERWQRQLSTAYCGLPQEEQASDLEEADRMLALLDRYEASRRCELCGNFTQGGGSPSDGWCGNGAPVRKTHGCRAWQPKEDGR